MDGKWLRVPDSGVAVVFLHGILSSIENCWQNDNGAFWPDLVMNSPEVQGCGVYAFAYRSSIFSGTYRLGDTVDALKEHMRLDDVFSCHTIIFVAHSMGGIVARKLIVSRASDFRNIKIGLFLVASPSLGSRYADFLSFLARAINHTHADALRFSQNNAWLHDLDREFLNLKESHELSLYGKELVEDNFFVMKGIVKRQVVEPFSGARYFGEAVKIAGSNHFSISKPTSDRSIQHRLLVKFITGLIDSENASINSRSFNDKSIKKLENGVIMEYHDNDFVRLHKEFISNYGTYFDRLTALVRADNGAGSIQCIVDFFSLYGKPLVDRYPGKIGVSIINAVEEFMISVHDVEIFHDPDKPDTHKYAIRMGNSGMKLNEMIYRWNPQADSK